MVGGGGSGNGNAGAPAPAAPAAAGGGVSVEEAKSLICELCRLFYDQGWVSGTGGGISVKAAGGAIVMAPSGVQKERMEPRDMFVLDGATGAVLHEPEARPPPCKAPKLSECAPLFQSAYELRNAGAVIHGHSLHAVLATLLDPRATEFRVTHLEMIKGLEGHGFYDTLAIPIIENTARECELTDRLRQAILDYPRANAVLVRRHGVYVWGRDWIQAKTQAECYDYLFAAAVKMRQLGLDASRPPPPLLPPLPPLPTSNGTAAAKRPAQQDGEEEEEQQQQQHAANGATKRARTQQQLPAAVVLDIEGTVAPVSYVADVMFPFARARAAQHLLEHYDSPEAQADLDAIREQAAADAAAAGAAAPPITVPPASAGKEAVVAAAAAWVDAAIASDRKVGALKQLQGHVWRAGFRSGALRAELFRDVPDALVEWRDLGLKTYIYSSGSREAQALFFGHSQAGDLTPYLCGYFDTTSGAKGDARSYREIALALGASDAPGRLLFATDVLAEAEAARAAGWRAVLVARPGNKPLPEGHGFRVIESMAQLLQ